MVVDLGRLRDLEVLDASRCIVRVGAGARRGEVAQALDRHDMALTSGDYGGVGVGGLASGGGVGLLARRQGLTIDRVRAVEVALADGTLVRADREQRADLLWAVRSAGGAFGAVTAFEFQADRIGWVTSARRRDSRARRPQLESAWEQGMARHLRGTYLNLETEGDDSTLRRAFPPPALARLQERKRRYDPAGVFDHSLPCPGPVSRNRWRPDHRRPNRASSSLAGLAAAERARSGGLLGGAERLAERLGHRVHVDDHAGLPPAVLGVLEQAAVARDVTAVPPQRTASGRRTSGCPGRTAAGLALLHRDGGLHRVQLRGFEQLAAEQATPEAGDVR